ncbi:MAG: hypothetical protein LUO82_03835 [Methanomicrobiales archaeon]|nr:hypothetical protein [Methanomicrobiales archaeon]
MSEKVTRKQVRGNGRVECTKDEFVTIDHCRFCVHSTAFAIHGRSVPSPARIYCLYHTKSDETINFSEVEAVECDDMKGEGFRSMMNIIS